MEEDSGEGWRSNRADHSGQSRTLRDPGRVGARRIAPPFCEESAVRERSGRPSCSRRCDGNPSRANYDNNATGLIKLDIIEELIMDLVVKELQLRENPYEASQEFVLFNFSKNKNV